MDGGDGIERLGLRLGRLRQILSRSEIRYRGLWTWNRSIGESGIVPIGLHPQELLVHQRLKHHVTQSAVDAAQSLELFRFQLESGHFCVLRADSMDDVLNR